MGIVLLLKRTQTLRPRMVVSIGIYPFIIHRHSNETAMLIRDNTETLLEENLSMSGKQTKKNI